MKDQRNLEEIVPRFSGKYRGIIVFGPPGAGKGTVCKTLARAGGHLHVSTGDILRGLSHDSPAGQLADKYANQGLLVPDDAMIAIWRNYIDGLVATNRFSHEHQFLFLDGLPRTANQASILKDHVNLEQIIVLEVENKQILIERLKKRALIEGRADDASEKILRTRMEVYEAQTAEVLKYYEEAPESPKITRIKGDQLKLEVLRDILNVLAAELTL